jgi:HSP20 family molecular chaperone IbpA
METKRRRSIFDMVDEYFERLKEWTERFEKIFFEKPSWDCKTCTIEPLQDISVTPNVVIVTVDLHYAEENTIRVRSINEGTIEISAEMKRKVSFDDFGITHYKGEFNRFRCETRIPVPVDMKRMEVRFRKGMLEVRLPRKYDYEIPVE